MARGPTETLAETLSVFDGGTGAGEPLSTAEVAAALGTPESDAADRLSDLERRGVVSSKRLDGAARIWWPTGDGEHPSGDPSVAVASGADETGVLLLDADYQVIGANDRVLEYFGLDRDAVEGTDARELVHRRLRNVVDDHESYAAAVLEAYENDVPASFEVRVHPGDDRQARWLEHRSQPVRSGSTAGERVEVFEDVSDRARPEGSSVAAELGDLVARRGVEEALRRESALTEEILETSPTGIAVFGPDGTLEAANERIRRLLGLDDDPEDYVAGQGDLYDQSGEPIREGQGPVGEALETGEAVYGHELRVETPGGNTRWVSVNASPLTDDGSVERVVATAEDVTTVREQARRLERQRDELREKRDELREERDELREELDEVFERVDDAFYALDEEFRFTYVNERAEELLQASEEELLGEPVWEQYPEATDTPAWDAFHEAMETQEPTSYEVYFDPLDFWVETTVYPSENGLSVHFRDVTDRKERERRLEQRREQLAVLDDLNAVVRSVTGAVVEQSTREEIEQVVCETIADADAYEFAWFARVDPASGRVEPTTQVGADGYLDEVEISSDPDDPTGRGPTGRAIQTGEMQVVRDVDEAEGYEPWRDAARRYGFRASAAIPVTHEGTLYGVLNVYADREDAFADAERDVVGQLGEVVGHAIAAVERKRALMGDEVVEVEFAIEDVFADLDLPGEPSGVATVDRTIPIGDGAYLVFGSASDDGLATLRDVTDALPHWESTTVLEERGGRHRFELRLSEPPVLSAVASRGGRIGTARFEEGDLHLTVQLPPSVDVRGVVEVIQESYPGTEMVTRQQVTRDASSRERLERALEEALTERQRSALEAAYFAGFFEWPRNATGEEVADALGVSPPTFHQHVRAAERKLLESLFEETDG